MNVGNSRIYGNKPYFVAVIHGGPGAAGEMAPVARELSLNTGVLEPLQTTETIEIQMEELQDIKEKINNSESLLIRLKRYRDTRLAHHDAIVPSDASLPYGKVNKLVEDVKSMYNSLTKGHDWSVTSFEWLTHDAERHTSEVVRIMREERDKAIQRVKEIDNTTSIFLLKPSTAGNSATTLGT